MLSIPDDPIISCMERTGYPPWMCDGFGEYEEDSITSEEEEEND